jgi:N-acetylglucosamine-6-sulfatase
LRESRLRLWIALACVAALIAMVCVSCANSSGRQGADSRHPNIVFIVADDLDLASYTADPALFPKVHDLMAEQGTTFSNAFVTDSLCCPSRASILRGQYVHNHGVEDNTLPKGGFETWHALGRETSTVATWMHQAGYRTALFGKYLNGYPNTVSPTYVPPGWDDWASPAEGNAYAEYNYQLNENGHLHDYGADPADYLVDVVAKKSVEFIDRNGGKQPLFLYVAPYVPHQPATPAPRYANAFPGAVAPRPPSFDQADVSAEPAYVRDLPLLGSADINFIDKLYRRRLQSMLGVEDLLSGVVAALARTHQLDNTYIVFISDNGFHLGQHRLPPGKKTPYEEDIHIPIVVRGPGVPAGKTVDSFAREIDLAPTFAEWGHAKVPDFVDGVSLAAQLRPGKQSSTIRDVLIEHYAPLYNLQPSASAGPDNDTNPPTAGAPTTGPAAPLSPSGVEPAIPPYRALRTGRYLYVEYSTKERELYDLVTDPYELHNLAATANTNLLAVRLGRLAKCSGRSCHT